MGENIEWQNNRLRGKKDVEGHSFKYTVQAKPEDTVETIKGKIYDREGVKPDYQRLVYAGKTLQDNKSLASYQIEDQATLMLLVRLLGGQHH